MGFKLIAKQGASLRVEGGGDAEGDGLFTQGLQLVFEGGWSLVSEAVQTRTEQVIRGELHGFPIYDQDPSTVRSA